MRSMGLDIGTDRVGVAISDESGIIAQPFSVIDTGGPGGTWLDDVGELIRTHRIETVVVGMPMSLSGKPGGESAAMAKKAGEKLRETAGVAVVYWDERFTTAQAERALVGARVRRKKRRAVIDKIAACLILQSYLDASERDE